MSRHAVPRTTALALMLFLASCGGGGGGGGTGGEPGKVAVTGGTASSAGTTGEQVHVFADPAPAGSVFDHWSGDTSTLDDPKSWHTTFRLGSRDVDLRAVFVSVPVWSAVQDSVNGDDFWYHVPSAPRGLVLFLHGTGGDAAQWFTDPEYVTFVRGAVARGYGVAALTTSDRIEDEWRLEPISTANLDVRNVIEGWTRLVSSGLIGPTTPLLVVGMSSGGRFSARLCSLVPCTAQALTASQGDPPTLMSTTTVPTRFNMLERDTQGAVDAGAAKEYSEQMIVRGVRSEFELFGASPVYPERFARIQGVSVDASRMIHAALVAGGFLDTRNFLVDDPYLNGSGWHDVIPEPYDEDEMLFHIAQQLDNAWSAHGFYSEHLPRTMRFFDESID